MKTTIEKPINVNGKQSGGQLARPPCSAFPPVLDVCCGKRAMWYDSKDTRAIFTDKRRESRQLDTRPGRSPCVINPDIQCDFTNLPFPDETFWHVVFDPPHILRTEPKGWITHTYGVLNGDWKEMLRLGFAECFRVLKPSGTLIFKWSDSNVPLPEILKLTPEKPMYGHRSGKQAQTHWCAFLKPNKAENKVSSAGAGLACIIDLPEKVQKMAEEISSPNAQDQP
jgi:SAM-dependent methyltransferase